MVAMDHMQAMPFNIAGWQAKLARCLPGHLQHAGGPAKCSQSTLRALNPGKERRMKRKDTLGWTRTRASHLFAWSGPTRRRSVL